MSIPVITKTTHDASFSSHLNGGEEIFVPKYEGTNIQSLISSIYSHPIFLKPNTAEEGEIEVFGAEKYFSEGLNHSLKITLKNSSSHHHQKDDSLEVFSIKEEAKIDPQSIRSESSWHSRSMPFHNIPRNQKKHIKAKRRSFLTSMVCWCSCMDKNSVDFDDFSGVGCSRRSTNTVVVNDKSLQGDKTSNHLVSQSASDYNYVKFNEPELKANSKGNFSFHATTDQAGKMKVQDEEDRSNLKSLEAIPSPVQENGKKLNMMPWDAIAEEIKIPSGTHEGSDSDASSDLFEIKSLSKGSPFLSRQASDIPSGSITPKTGYAPSESSMEWGFATASAADMNISPDYEEPGFSSPNALPCPWEFSPNPSITSFEETHEHHSSVLSGCNSQKAVSVAGTVHGIDQPVFSGARRPPRMHSLTPTTRFSQRTHPD